MRIISILATRVTNLFVTCWIFIRAKNWYKILWCSHHILHVNKRKSFVEFQWSDLPWPIGLAHKVNAA